MLLAAGLGTRLKPFTDSHPKALAVINGKTLLQRNIEYLQGFGIFDVIVNVHHFADQIISTIREHKGWGSRITISDERSEVLETGGGLMKAASFFNNETNFVLMNCDVLTNMPLADMIETHRHTKALATLAVSVRKTSRYFLFDEDNNLKGWQNKITGEVKPATINADDYNAKAFSGIHVINTQLFNLVQQTGKFSMVDVYLSLCSTHSIKSYDHSSSLFIDVGKPESIASAERLFH